MVAAHRNDRPWSGEWLDRSAEERPRFDPDCYLCPGAVRVGGARNDDYDGIFVFDNDRPCVGVAAPTELAAPPPPYRIRPANGVARVVCYSPRHDQSLSELRVSRVADLLRCWQAQFAELSARPEVQHVLIFENRGEAVGVSNPHPHGQIYATNFVFKTIEVEADACRDHWREHGRSLFGDILDAEVRDGRRVLDQNDVAIGFVPYFARYAYEAFVAPRARHRDITGLDAREVDGLAEVLSRLLVRYDNLWRLPFPYVMALHQAPVDGGDHDGFHFHIELHPPLRKPGLLKYLAGPEIGGGSFLSDSSPEEKAAELRAASLVHYRAGRDQ